MDVSLDQVLNSKVYVKEDSLISFGSPRQYIEPFVEKLQGITNNFRVSVSDRVANKEESGSINEAYGRVLIEAKLPNEFCAYNGFMEPGYTAQSFQKSLDNGTCIYKAWRFVDDSKYAETETEEYIKPEKLEGDNKY